MATETFYLFAPISSVSGAVNSLFIHQDLKISKWSADRINRVHGELQDAYYSQSIGFQIETNKCLGNSKTYGWVLHASIEIDRNEDVEYIDDVQLQRTFEKYNEIIENKLLLTRLYAGGSVRVMGPYWYIKYENGSYSIIHETVKYNLGIGNRTHLSSRLFPQINEFIEKTTTPLKPSFIDLALQSYSISQEIPHNHLRFLSLMMALEILFNISPQELSYRIGRSTAILLGRSKNESMEIASTIKSLYSKRSRLVHNGKASDLSHDDIDTLETIVRKSILALYKLGKNKEDLAEIFTALGFGDWRD